MLDEMGYERLRVMEIPIPEPPIGTIIDSSLQHVENALRSFNEGDYNDVLVNCRMALEELERADLDLASLPASESKKEKMDVIEKKLKDFDTLRSSLYWILPLSIPLEFNLRHLSYLGN